MVPWVPLAAVPRPLGQQNTLKSLFSGPNRGITANDHSRRLRRAAHPVRCRLVSNEERGKGEYRESVVGGHFLERALFGPATLLCLSVLRGS
jgi:hypothetical protein